MKPKISKIAPFKYEKIKTEMLFCFIRQNCGNSGAKTKPVIITKQLSQTYEGYQIDQHRDGIECDAVISIPFSEIDTETVSKNTDSLISNWLINIGCPELVDY